SLRRSKVWSRTSFDVFGTLAKRPESGAFVRPVTYYFKRPIDEDRLHRAKMDELREFVGGFRHEPALIRENAVNPDLGLRDAYTHLAPMVDTDVYMRWLIGEVRSAGCRILEHKIGGPLSTQAQTLARQFEVDAIVNCSGLGAAELAGEAMYPLRGA